MKKKLKLKISQTQFNQMRIMYAIGLTVKYQNLKPKDIFEGEGLNPKWIKGWDVMGMNHNPEEFARMISKKLEKEEKTEYGLFQIKRTKKGCIIYAGIRIRGKYK